MKITTLRFISLFVAVLLCGCTEDPMENGIGENGSDPINSKIIYKADRADKGELLVKFSSEVASTLDKNVTRSGNTRSGVSGFDAVMSDIGAVSIERLFPVDERNEARTKSAGLDMWYVLKFSDKASLEATARRLASIAEVVNVQYNVRVKRVDDSKALPLADFNNAVVQTRADAQFNDPKLSSQWHYINTGNTSLASPMKAGADINCGEAWKLCAGDPSIIVAVVDGGVMYSHEDLADNMWVNEVERDGQPNTDNDGNGYKNDVYGFNFVYNQSNIVADDHGTHVAGTVAAVNNNGKGVCGVAGGSGNHDGVRIMSCEIFEGDNGASTSNTAKAIKYAADNGAVILQCSWGYDSGEFMSDDEWIRYSSVERDAIDYFINNAGSETGTIKGGLAIFAAGNESGSIPGYPSAYSKVICVAAMASDFTASSFSNYGSAVDITAPGGDSDYTKSEEGTILSTIPGRSKYGYMEGTSMATPHVSGVAALGLSYAAKLGKHYTASEFRGLLLSSVNDINQYLIGTKKYYYYYLSYGTKDPRTMNLADYKNKMGAGYVDAYKLLLSIKGVPAIMLRAGESQTLKMSDYFGGSSSQSYGVRISDTNAKEAMGLETSMVSGVLTVSATKYGNVTLTLVTSIGGAEAARDVVVMCRGGIDGSGGWL